MGKTYLINQYLKNKGVYFEIAGIKGANKASQLNKFHREFCRLFPVAPDLSAPESWDEALSRLVDEIAKINPNQKFILFLMNYLGWQRLDPN